MYPPSSPLSLINLRDDLPRYPPLQQAVRVTGGTVPGPNGYASSSALSPALYLGFTQQLHPSTLLPRDREPCLVLDLNRFGLAPGYYDGRLAGSFHSLPVYEVGNSTLSQSFFLATTQPFGSSSGIFLPTPGGGLTPDQVESLKTLTPDQFSKLSNLTPCQVQTLLSTLPISQVQTLTIALSQTQLSNFVNLTTQPQLQSLYNQLTISQIDTLSTALNINQFQIIVNALTPTQIQTLVTNLTQTQIQTLSSLSTSQLSYLINNLTTTQLVTILQNLNNQQLQTLFGLPTSQMVYLIQNLTTNQITTTLTNLNTQQIQTLLSLTTAQIAYQITNLTTNQLKTYLNQTRPLSGTTIARVSTQTGTSYTFSISDLGSFVVFNNGSAITGTLVGAAIVGPGWYTTIWNSGSGTLTLTPTTGTINGASSLSVPPLTGTTIWSDGSNYQIASGGAGLTSSSVGVTGTYGRAALSSPYTTTGSAANVLLNVTLPVVGTYLLTCLVDIAVSSSVGVANINALLYNTTAGAQVNDSQIVVASTSTIDSVLRTATIVCIHTTTTINNVIDLQAWGPGMGGGATVNATTTVLSYIRLA